jgi:hypothetical protein
VTPTRRPLFAVPTLGRVFARATGATAQLLPVPTFFGLLTLYLVVQAGVRLLMWESLEYDESEQLVFGQRLASWYSAQPPLYTWLVYGLTQVLGPSVLLLSIVKFALLGALYLLLRRLAGQVAAPPLAAVAAFTPLLSPLFAWESVRIMTHTTLMCVAALGAVLTVLRLRAGAGTGAFLALGAWVGLGGMAKYNFVFFVVALVAAVLSLPEYRAAVFRRRLWLSVAVAAVIAGPHAVVAVAHVADVREALAARVAPAEHVGAVAAARGLADIAVSVFGGLVGACVLALLCRPARDADPDPDAPTGDAARLLGRVIVVSVVVLLVLTVATGSRRVPTHWLAPPLLLAPLWLLATTRTVTRRQLVRCYAILAVAAVAGVLGRAALFVGTPAPERPQSRDHAYAELCQRLKAEGLASAPVLATDPLAGGYVRLHLPDAPVYDGARATESLPRSAVWVVVWNGARPVQLVNAVGRLELDPATEIREGTIVGPRCGPIPKQHAIGYLIIRRPEPPESVR